MYFPYFRGRQYELLALKELASQKLISESIIPIVEPIKQIPALKNALKAFNDTGLPIGIIVNPEVGGLVGKSNEICSILSTYQSTAFPGILINDDTQSALKELDKEKFNQESLLTIVDDQDKRQVYENMGLNCARYTLCPFDRYVMQMSIKNGVLFEDKFRKRSRNADYPEDEPFSRDHLDFSEFAFGGNKFVGFGDYSIIGKEYNESGFAPYAVAIHIVYFANDASLRIRHFVSDSNDDITDVAGKFYEAVSKLHKWYTTEGQERQLTVGLKTLLDHYHNKTYPGLPTLKKLSVMHHLELVGRYLDGEKK